MNKLFGTWYYNVELKPFNGIELIEQKGEKPEQYKDWDEE